jgi:hypothetical protein
MTESEEFKARDGSAGATLIHPFPLSAFRLPFFAPA